MPAVFEVDEIGSLPLFAQGLIASRMARRAALFMPEDIPAACRRALLDLCDALDAACTEGRYRKTLVQPLADRVKALRGGPAGAAADAAYWAWDCVAAAEAAQDFPVDETCRRDARQTIAAAANVPGLSPLQVHLYAAADLDLLRFACRQNDVGPYDGLGAQTLAMLPPVYPPDRRREV